jgi:hypothetical protein
MKIHELKTINSYFIDILYEKKLFEIRKNDRDFKVGDMLYLREYDPDRIYPSHYTGRWILVEVEYILPENKFEGLSKDYCCMGIEIIKIGIDGE